jgi:hypothetical protein
MTDYESDFRFEDIKRQLDIVNRERWKYESLSKPSVFHSLKKQF